PRFGRLHREKDVYAERRVIALSRVWIIGIHASGLLLPRDNAPQRPIAIVDPNVGTPVGRAPFTGRLGLGGRTKTCKEKCRSPDRWNGAHDVLRSVAIQLTTN